jgi:putative hemolysin
MSIVKPKEVSLAIGLEKLGFLGELLAKGLMQLTKIENVNQLYNRHSHLKGVEFIDAILLDLGVQFEIPEKDLKRIPTKGPFVTVSNHPLGGVDGLILLKILLITRPDFKVIANFLLHRIQPLEPYVLPVNPFEDKKDVKSSVLGIKKSIAHVRDGHALGIFPAGEVSTHRLDHKIVDKPWSIEAIKLIQRLDVPVLPIYFHAKNSNLFYQLAKISDNLRTAQLPREVFSQKHRSIKVRLGNLIQPKELHEHTEVEELSYFLRTKTYMLANAYEKKRLLDSLPKHIKLPKAPKEIIREGVLESFIEEVDACREAGKRLLESNQYEVFLAKKKWIPNILVEIGRLREITFRSVGEGTNLAVDLDKYDEYYHHMFLWDNQAQKIAGAYRMGLGTEIFKTHGIEGFYLNELFRFEEESHHILKNAIEMGRAFITATYQLKPMPLFLLWKGIVHCTIRFPEHKYLIGGVSISNKFSNFSKSIMIEFMKSNYYDPYLAQFIHARKEFKVKLKDQDKDFVFNKTEADLNKFDKIIDEIEPDNLRLPVLIKKYIKQNARVVAFNVDPLFNNAIDGLMYIRVKDLPESTVKPVLEDLQKELEKKAKKRKD